MELNHYENEFYNSIFLKRQDQGDSAEDASTYAIAALTKRREAFGPTTDRPPQE